MARTSKTFYTCDVCGKEVESGKLLRSFVVEGRNQSGHGGWATTGRVDMCASCEDHFLKAVAPFFSLERVAEVSRPEVKA